MFSQLKQTAAMTGANLGSLPRRAWIATSMVLSVALVVAVLTGFLSMAKGFEKTLAGAGSASVAIVLGGGTNQEIGSDIPADLIRNLRANRGETGIARDSAGAAIVSREILVPIDVKRLADGVDQTLALRGMDQAGPAVRDGVALSQGRLFAPGSREIVVGARLAGEFAGFGVGDRIRLGSVDWTVVGQFSAGGSAFESEIWADIEAVQSAFDRQGQVQTLRARLESPSSLPPLRATLASAVKTPVAALSEAEFYASQSARTSSLIRLFGWPIALLMAIGATAGALNTMMSSVSDRTVEIATLRTLGFGRLAAFTATWIEAVLLSLVGAAIGAAVSWLVFNGWQASTLGANNTRMAFQLTVTGSVMLQAGLLGLAIGVVGGTLPAFVATRLPLSAALAGRG
ncbi:MAG: FtsX-like permease family protein [Mesorhizobium sp.]|uniref:ABC transporter permease n=1 Tax=Mesorhizobium sp. TaxID=1871066 RepID=UPI001AC48AB4|nr:ABC transporter permease [Mesorhizobium sp.]MBN9222236.1 FtsX-like permease family protein [Mesorhizobium sp.]